MFDILAQVAKQTTKYQMANLFTKQAFSEVVDGLHSLYYSDRALLGENYGFTDWFAKNKEKRTIPAAVFGQTPTDYETACIGVATSNGDGRQSLVNKFRALGAPIILEVDYGEIREWAVSRLENGHELIGRYPVEAIRQMFVDRTPVWRPEALLRAKNIGKFHSTFQPNLFSGLLPELEEKIQESLEPILKNTLVDTIEVYRQSTGREPDGAQLFKLIFWILTAKVFCDRQVNGFTSLSPDADEILKAVAHQYREPVPDLLNREAREAAVAYIWNGLDFRNLSVEVLSQMWTSMLVDKDTKKRLGIHRTSRTIVQYIVEKIPFDQTGDNKRIIFEPCSGSAGFLIGVMNKLRKKLFGMNPEERHEYFIQHFAGIEQEFIGVEISKLALTLADFPNPGGWNIAQGDVFAEGVMTNHLRQSAVVLCNPPFQLFEPEIRNQYRLQSPWKPIELLYRVLKDLHPSGVLGFVLPLSFVDGKGSKEIRRQLAERFAVIDVTALPDRAFDDASVEPALLVAKEPIAHNTSKLFFQKVYDSEAAWKSFEFFHDISFASIGEEKSVEELKESFAVADLPDVWDYLINYPSLEDIAEIHRGLEWNLALTTNGKETGNRSILVKDEPTDGYMIGVAPQTKFNAFEVPRKYYLNVREEFQRRNSFRHSWEKPKVIMNAAARSRGAWRIAAFPDSEGVTCYQTFTGVWSKSPKYDEWILSAILNSPVANAFVATREGKVNTTTETLKKIPIPHFTEPQKEQLNGLIKRYQNAAKSFALLRDASDDPESLLKQIDALVLNGYRMPPRLERQLLDFFNGHGQKRPVPHDFGDYFPTDFEAYFSLSEYLKPEFQTGSFGDLIKHLEARTR